MSFLENMYVFFPKDVHAFLFPQQSKIQLFNIFRISRIKDFLK